MNEPWAIESILNGTGGGGGGGNPIPPITNVYVPVESWKYQDRIIDVVGFPWVADVPYPNVKASDFVSVIFGQEDAESGIFSNVCESRTDAVRIFASEKPTKRIRIDTLSGFRPNASNSIWGHITGDILEQNDLVDFVGDSNKIETIKANGTSLSITDKSVNIPVATESSVGLLYQTRSRYNVYVSPSGNDTTGDGTQSNPWRTVLKAIKTIQSLNIPADYYTINIEEGEYEFTETEISITRNIEFVVNGDVLFNLTLTAKWAYFFSVRDNAKIIIVGRASTYTLTMEYTGGGTTSEEYAFAFRQGSLYISNINVINKFRNGIFYQPIASPTPRRLVSRNNLIISNTGKLTLENGRVDMHYGIIQSGGEITYGDGNNHEVLQLHYGTIASVKSITGTYSIDGSSMLSINGKWVNQE